MRTEDGCLIRQCLNGDETAFNFLVDKYQKAVYASAYAKLGDFADAEDITQEVFIKAYQSLRKLKYYDRFCSWLYVITANLCISFLRSKTSRPDGAFVEDIQQEVLDNPAMKAYQTKKAHEPLYEALEELPDIYREVLTLYYLGGMKSRDIAEFVGVSPNTIEKRLSRARAKLKEEIIIMMSGTFDEMRLQPSFTFRVVEAIRRTKIQTPASKAQLPVGVSTAAGLIVLLLSFTVPQSPLYPIGQLIGSALPAQMQVTEDGIIPVDTIEITEIVSLSIADGDFGKKPSPKPSERIFGVGEWEREEDMPTARNSLTAATVKGKIYAIGGFTRLNVPIEMDGIVADLNVIPTVEEYNPETGFWARKKDMPTARDSASTAVVDGKIYVIGGLVETFPINRLECLSIVEVYDPMTNTWAPRADMPTPRARPSISVVNGKIYVIGGWNFKGGIGEVRNIQTLSVVEMYNPVTDTWTEGLEPMPTASCMYPYRAIWRKTV